MRIRVGAPADGAPLEHFLTARCRLHVAELLEFDDRLIAATGLPALTTAPVSALYAPSVYGRFGLPRL